MKPLSFSGFSITAVLLSGIILLLFYLSPNTYTITKPFPLPSKEELYQLSGDAFTAACTIPEQTARKMSTAALLETYLNHAKPFIFFGVTYYGEAFKSFRQRGCFGLEELMEREDLIQTLISRYRKLPLLSKPIEPPFTEEMEEIAYEAGGKLWLLDVLCAQLELNSGGRQERRLLAMIEEKNAQRALNHPLYGGPNMYEWTTQQDLMRGYLMLPR